MTAAAAAVLKKYLVFKKLFTFTTSIRYVLDTSMANDSKYTGDGGIGHNAYEKLRWQKANTSGTPPAARACHTLTRLGWKLYMFGGYDGQKCFNDMDILDLETM